MHLVYIWLFGRLGKDFLFQETRKAMEVFGNANPSFLWRKTNCLKKTSSSMGRI